MDTDAAVRDAEAARLLEALADLTADGEALAALRKEAAAFRPADGAVRVMLDLLATDPDEAAFDDSLSALDALVEKLGHEKSILPSMRLLDGLARLDRAQEDPRSPRATKLRAALLKCLRASSGGAS
ncbi:MAG: hypothetical protein SF051_00455 [Elusimicrobiota bacterium]|nr:hypothetical protein [Elusimicrobiota bacterium]